MTEIRRNVHDSELFKFTSCLYYAFNHLKDYTENEDADAEVDDDPEEDDDDCLFVKGMNSTPTKFNMWLEYVYIRN